MGKITTLLKPDSKVIQENLKSILDKEENYAEFLFAIEETVTNEFLSNKKIKDKTIINHLKHFLKNIDEDMSYFDSNFEKHLYQNIIDSLDIKLITKHELTLCIKYILWSIGNRSWLNDSQAYVKWLAHSSGVMTESESKSYENKIRIFCKRKGVPQKQIEAMLKNDFSDVEVIDKVNTNIESEFFALNNDKKLDFVIEHFQEAPFLGELYYSMLMEDKNYDMAEELCKSILEIMPEFPPMEFLLGIVYKEKKNKILAKHHFENALRIMDEIPADVIPEKDILIKQTKDLIKEVS